MSARPARAGRQPTAAATSDQQPATVRLISFRPVITGALRGYANVEWRAAGLIWLGVAIFVGADGKGWAGVCPPRQ